MEQRNVFPVGPPDLTPERLEAELRQRLAAAGPPGRRWAPRLRDGLEGAGLPRGDHDLNPDFYEPGRALIPAAVLVPLVDRGPQPTVLLTRRTDHLHDHAGQVSFPGGRVDARDSGPQAAALRETAEEVGLAEDRISVLGQLDTYVTRTGFEVTPVVGLVSPPFDIKLDPFEVAEVFEVPLTFFLSPDSRQTHSREYQGRIRHFYVYPYQDHYIWGATAGMLSNLAELLTNPPNSDQG